MLSYPPGQTGQNIAGFNKTTNTEFHVRELVQIRTDSENKQGSNQMLPIYLF